MNRIKLGKTSAAQFAGCSVTSQLLLSVWQVLGDYVNLIASNNKNNANLRKKKQTQTSSSEKPSTLFLLVVYARQILNNNFLGRNLPDVFSDDVCRVFWILPIFHRIFIKVFLSMKFKYFCTFSTKNNL